jgi:hypothetical protein
MLWKKEKLSRRRHRQIRKRCTQSQWITHRTPRAPVLESQGARARSPSRPQEIPKS